MEGANKFNRLIAEETLRLEILCTKWQNVLDTTKGVSEELQDQIRSVVGQTKLLLKQKFRQFSELVEKYKVGHGDVNITADDLEGFWDLILIQINGLKIKFGTLEDMSTEPNGYHNEINGKIKH